MILLDTSVLAAALRRQPDPALLAWLDAQALESLYLATITVAELNYRISRLPGEQRMLTLLGDLNERVLPLFQDRILPFGLEAVAAYAVLRGPAPGTADAYIAAIAAAHGLTVAARAPRPFQDAGVPVINPWQPL